MKKNRINKLACIISILLSFLILVISNATITYVIYYLGLSFVGLFIYRRIIQIGDIINEQCTRRKSQRSKETK